MSEWINTGSSEKISHGLSEPWSERQNVPQPRLANLPQTLNRALHTARILSAAWSSWWYNQEEDRDVGDVGYVGDGDLGDGDVGTL